MKLKWMLLAFSIFAFSNTASAAITGDIAFSGGFTTDTGDKDTATVFTFINPVDVTNATGSFSPLLTAGSVTYNPLNINSIPASNPLWTATVSAIDYSFDINNITLDTVIIGTRYIKAEGVFTIGTETQQGIWNFSTQGSATDGEFSFSASQETTVVPIPAAIWLFGSGLLGLIGIARHKKA